MKNDFWKQKKGTSMKSLQNYRRNIYSQSGEDGVIAEIMRRFGVTQGWFCEFGAWDGKYGSNTYSLLRQGWSGVMIEGDLARFKALTRTAKASPGKLFIQHAYVSYDKKACNPFIDAKQDEYSLDHLLAKTPIPKDFDVLSIDIDSYDYHVWQSLKNYLPKLVIIEIDSSTIPGESYVYNGEGRLTSFSAMLELGLSKNYTLVCHTGNMLFVANEYVDLLSLDPGAHSNPESLFISDWVSPTRLQIFLRKMRNMTWQRAVTKAQNFFVH